MFITDKEEKYEFNKYLLKEQESAFPHLYLYVSPCVFGAQNQSGHGSSHRAEAKEWEGVALSGL